MSRRRPLSSFRPERCRRSGPALVLFAEVPDGVGASTLLLDVDAAAAAVQAWLPLRPPAAGRRSPQATHQWGVCSFPRGVHSQKPTRNGAAPHTACGRRPYQQHIALNQAPCTQARRGQRWQAAGRAQTPSKYSEDGCRGLLLSNGADIGGREGEKREKIKRDRKIWAVMDGHGPGRARFDPPLT
jgi:hypothetical protein